MKEEEHIEVIDGKVVSISGPAPRPIDMSKYRRFLDLEEAREKEAAEREAGKVRPPRYVDLLDLEQLPPLEYLSDFLPIPRGGYAVAFGPPAGGKSFWALDRALRLASKGEKVVYIPGEGLSGFPKRTKAWLGEFGQGEPLERGLFTFKTCADNMLDDKSVTSLITDLAAMGAIALVVIDTLARSMVGGDENSAVDMGRYNSACLKIQEETGATVLVLHHTGKAGGSERGSSSLRGAADTMFDISTDDDGKVTVECSKQKDGEPFKPYYLQRTVINLEDGSTSCVLKPTDGLISVRGKIITDEHFAVLKCLAEPIYQDVGAQTGQIKSYVNYKRSDSTFTRLMSALRDWHYVVQPNKIKTDPYKLTEEGRTVLLEELARRGQVDF